MVIYFICSKPSCGLGIRVICPVSSSSLSWKDKSVLLADWLRHAYCSVRRSLALECSPVVPCAECGQVIDPAASSNTCLFPPSKNIPLQKNWCKWADFIIIAHWSLDYNSSPFRSLRNKNNRSSTSLTSSWVWFVATVFPPIQAKMLRITLLLRVAPRINFNFYWQSRNNLDQK